MIRIIRPGAKQSPWCLGSPSLPGMIQQQVVPLVVPRGRGPGQADPAESPFKPPCAWLEAVNQEEEQSVC